MFHLNQWSQNRGPLQCLRTAAPPPVHSREEEGFFILEGEITLMVGDRLKRQHLPETRIVVGPVENRFFFLPGIDGVDDF